MPLSVKQKRSTHFIYRMLTHPRLLLNTLLTLIGYKLKWEKVYGQPLGVDLEPTNACNFRCPHCQVTYADWTKRTMQPELFKKSLDSFPYSLRVKLQGMGEPFINKHLMEYTREVCERKYWCEITTNGSLFAKRPIHELEKYDNFQLTVSIDAADTKLFEDLRPGSDFDKIIKELKTLTQNTRLQIAAWMVVLEQNQDQIEAVIRLLKSINIKLLGLQMVVVDYGKSFLRSKTVEKRVHISDKEHFHQQMQEFAKNHDVVLDIADGLYDRKKICPWPWEGVFIDANGNVVPCCRIGDASVCNMGNLNDSRFVDIWNSEKYQEFRRWHKNDQIPEYCKSCYRTRSE